MSQTQPNIHQKDLAPLPLLLWCEQDNKAATIVQVDVTVVVVRIRRRLVATNAVPTRHRGSPLKGHHVTAVRGQDDERLCEGPIGSR
ncbi:hypothetical protein L195_g056936 [Trifolium pratense]|uniref:Uncharacterized protein n=1 Tax=Trifolium pratense TaxID=57577 RepID=A0A2K3KU88_TRIPR|nr:hypothetical protein L195_g056936 [Trifolium pratense]